MLTWEPAANAVGYHIQRSEDPRAAATTGLAQVGDVTHFSDPGAMETENLLFYVVRGSSPTGTIGS